MDEAAVLSLHTRLQERLDTLFASIPHKKVLVATQVGNLVAFASVTSGPGPHSDPEAVTFRTGCLTKLLTSSLMVRESVDLDTPAAEFVATPLKKVLARTTVRDLLEHTHGLDDSLVRSAPIRANGRVNGEDLLASLADGRLSDPGELYSYSNAGAWILALILERLHDRPFSEHLQDALSIPARRNEPSLIPEVSHVCAAMGAGLFLSAKDMLTFLESEVLARASQWLPKIRRTAIRPLSGWSPWEQGVYCGWKYYGDDWFGHNSVFPGASAVVRVQPHRGMALLVASEYHNASAVAVKLFGDVLEHQSMSVPELLPAADAAQLDVTSYCGRYRRKAETVVVEKASDGALRLIAPGFDAMLAPAVGDTFVVRAARGSRLTFVGFLRATKEGFQYLWDGQRLFLRGS